MVNEDTAEGPAQPVAETTEEAQVPIGATAEVSVEDAVEEAPAAEETEVTAAEEPVATAAEAEPAIGEEDDDLTCSVCRHPIMLDQDYLNASYGPVHAEPCSHQTVSR